MISPSFQTTRTTWRLGDLVTGAISESESRTPFGDEWYARVPAVHASLTGHPPDMFALPPTHDPSYWFAPYYLMRAVLGWSDCGLGLRTLLFNEIGTDAEPAMFLKRIWGRFGQLDALAYWAWTRGEHVGETTRPRALIQFRDRAWARRAEILAKAFGFGGSGDDYHLAGHVSVIEHLLYDSAPQTPPGEIIRRDEERVAAAIVERFEDWPRVLCHFGSLMPGSSWRISITSKSDGYLGSFQKCRSCRRWFQGDPEHHEWGHAYTPSTELLTDAAYGDALHSEEEIGTLKEQVDQLKGELIEADAAMKNYSEAMQAWETLQKARSLAGGQAEDGGLWPEDETSFETVRRLQKALKELHAALGCDVP